MLVIRVELHGAVTHQVTEIARMIICNNGSGDANKGNYSGVTFRGRSKEALDAAQKRWQERLTTGLKSFPGVSRRGSVSEYPRLRLHVWNLVKLMLQAMSYGKGGAEGWD